MQSLLQTKIWADFKARHGWRVLELPSPVQPILALERALPFGRSFVYAPEVSLSSHDQLPALAQAVRGQAPKALFFRLELFEPQSETTPADLTKAGYLKAFEHVQPEHRQWLDLTGDLEAIMAQMKEKGRYNVRLAERKGVTTRISTDTKDIEVFYSIFRQTAQRDGFAIRSLDYFQDLAATLFSNNLGELVIAESVGQTLCALLVTYFDGLASYLYGASSDAQRNLMAPYAAHWAAIQSAKEHGCHTYDLLQIAPPDLGEKAHKFSNLTRFKEQFGGRAVALAGSWDFVYKPLEYRIFEAAEKLRRH